MNHLVSLVKFKLFISCFLSAVFLGFRTILNAFLNFQQLMANYFPWKMNWATCRKYETKHLESPQDSTQRPDPIWHCYLWANKTFLASWPMLKFTRSSQWLESPWRFKCLSHRLLCGRNPRWRALAFVPLLTSLPLTKIGISILKFCGGGRSFQ